MLGRHSGEVLSSNEEECAGRALGAEGAFRRGVLHEELVVAAPRFHGNRASWFDAADLPEVEASVAAAVVDAVGVHYSDPGVLRDRGDVTPVGGAGERSEAGEHE